MSQKSEGAFSTYLDLEEPYLLNIICEYFDRNETVPGKASNCFANTKFYHLKPDC
jgi:hypothetical protein